MSSQVVLRKRGEGCPYCKHRGVISKGTAEGIASYKREFQCDKCKSSWQEGHSAKQKKREVRMEREAGWYWVRQGVEQDWIIEQWYGARWHGLQIGTEWNFVGPHIPGAEELTALLALRDGIDADAMETIEEQIPEHMLRLRMLLQTWIFLYRAASQPGGSDGK